MKTLIFGHGWIGGLLAARFDNVVYSTADIVDERAVRTAVETHHPTVVINAAGKCGNPNVDWCDATPDNRRLTWHANAVGPALVEKVCRERRVPVFVHLSSGCLWPGGQNITENAKPDPPSYYTWTKAQGEERLDKRYSLIIRFRMPFGVISNPRNLITKLLNYRQVITEQNSAVYILDLITAIRHLVDCDCRGVYNVANGGTLSAAQIMEMYKRLVDPNHEFESISYAELEDRKLVTSKRSNISLSVEKLRGTGFTVADCRSRMIDVLQNMKGPQ